LLWICLERAQLRLKAAVPDAARCRAGLRLPAVGERGGGRRRGGGGDLGERVLALRDDVRERVRGGGEVPRGVGGGLAEHISLVAHARAELGEVPAIGLEHGLGLGGERLEQPVEAPLAGGRRGGGGSNGLGVGLLLRRRRGRLRIGLGEDGFEEIHGGLGLDRSDALVLCRER
jgi:hypothetical protein